MMKIIDKRNAHALLAVSMQHLDSYIINKSQVIAVIIRNDVLCHFNGHLIV